MRERGEDPLEAGTDLDGESALDELVVATLGVFVFDESVGDVAQRGRAEQARDGGDELGGVVQGEAREGEVLGPGELDRAREEGACFGGWRGATGTTVKL